MIKELTLVVKLNYDQTYTWELPIGKDEDITGDVIQDAKSLLLREDIRNSLLASSRRKNLDSHETMSEYITSIKQDGDEKLSINL